MTASGTVGAALREGAAGLRAAGIEGAARDARLMMAAALEAPAARLVLLEAEPLPARAAHLYAAMIARRARRQPVSQIIGRRAFWGRAFAVTPDVLDPRPETESLIACALAGPVPARVLDLGTGSGALLVTLLAEWPESSGLGTDISPAALGVAARNAAAHGVAARARFRLADWTRGIDERFDLVVCNPPYIPAAEHAGLAPEVRQWEPAAALTPGPTGLEAYAAIAAGLAGVLAEDGRALFEVGAGQAEAVAAIVEASGLAIRATAPDLDGRARVLVVARRGGGSR